MGHEPPNIIEELDFVLTHPSSNAKIIEKFYNNWLYVYDTVPLFSIVDHMQKKNPTLLNEWSQINITVRSLLNEMEPSRSEESAAKRTITVNIDLSGLVPASNGIYQIPWETEIDEPVVRAYFKTKSLLVVDRVDGKVNLVGISQLEGNNYRLYVKKRRKIG